MPGSGRFYFSLSIRLSHFRVILSRGFPTEDTVDHHSISQNNGHAYERNDEHGLECSRGGGGIISRETVSGVNGGKGHVGIESEGGGSNEAQDNERAADKETAVFFLARAMPGQHKADDHDKHTRPIADGSAEKMRGLPGDKAQQKNKGYRCGQAEGCAPPSKALLKVVFRFHAEIGRSVKGEKEDGCNAADQTDGVEQFEKASAIMALGCDGQTAHDIAEGDTQKQRHEQAAESENNSPDFLRERRDDLGTEFHGYGPENERKENQHKGNIKSAENGGVDLRKGCEEGTATGKQPDLVTIPNGGDGTHGGAPFFFIPAEKAQDTHAQIKAVQEGISAKQNCYQGIPDCIQIHGHSPSSARDRIASFCTIRVRNQR